MAGPSVWSMSSRWAVRDVSRIGWRRNWIRYFKWLLVFKYTNRHRHTHNILVKKIKKKHVLQTLHVEGRHMFPKDYFLSLLQQQKYCQSSVSTTAITHLMGMTANCGCHCSRTTPVLSAAVLSRASALCGFKAATQKCCRKDVRKGARHAQLPNSHR